MALFTAQLGEEQLLSLLLKKVDYWGEKLNRDLYKKMYQAYIDDDSFKGRNFDINTIVYDDVCHYCTVITQKNYPQAFEKLLQLYHQNKYDVSCESFDGIHPSLIEAVSDDETRILIRY